MEQVCPHFIRQNVDISAVAFYYNMCPVVCHYSGPNKPNLFLHLYTHSHMY